MKKLIFSFGLCLLCIQPAFASIEVVISPDVTSNSVEIMRWTIYRDGNTVKYGRCDLLEAQCTPDSPSLILQRELPYDQYIKTLASRFNIPQAYLEKHQTGVTSYVDYRQMLQTLIENTDASDSERAQAKAKFDLLTGKGGTLERYFKALALKREIEWPRTDEEKMALLEDYPSQAGSPSGAELALEPQMVFTYEKSMRQFEEALYPINFAAPLKGDPRKIEEPSTGLTWLLAGSALTFTESGAVCERAAPGFRPPSVEQLKYSAAWLGKSTIGDLIPTINDEKFVWIYGSFGEKRNHKGKKYQTIQTSPNSSKSGDFDYFFSSYTFPAAAIWPAFRQTSVTMDTTEEKSLSREDILAKYGATGTKLGVLCVGPTRF
jgi:hypothetical protein